MIVQGSHEPLVSRELWDAVKVRLEEQARLYPAHARREQPVNFSLKGLVRCSACGATLIMAYAPKEVKNRSMQCCNYNRGSCHVSHSVVVKKLESAIIDGLRQAVGSQSFAMLPRKPQQTERKGVDYDKLIEEFEKSTYLRSLYTVKQINDNYPLIIAGDYRDKEKHVDGVTAGREYMADRERWYSERKAQAENKAEEILKRFMTDETFKSIERRLRELMPEIARLEVDADKGEIKAKQKLVKLTQEQGRLRQQRLTIIERNGMSEEDLIPQWHCKKCQDSGYQEDGKMCDCYGG
jgi:hypothetical protein